MNIIRKQITNSGDTTGFLGYQFDIPLYQTAIPSGLYSQVQLGENILVDGDLFSLITNSIVPPNASGTNASYGGTSLQLQGETESKLEEIRTFGGGFLIATGTTDNGLLNQTGPLITYPVIYRYEGIEFTDISPDSTIYTISNSGLQPEEVFYDPLVPSTYSQFAFSPITDIDVELVRDNSSVFDIYKKIEFVDTVSNIGFYRITNIFSDF